jgi:putative hemolysin
MYDKNLTYPNMDDGQLKLHLNQVVKEYDRNNKKMDVLKMRQYIKFFIINIFPEKEKYKMKERSRGLWQKAPEGWPGHIPFVDPNNALPDYAKKKSDKKSPKPGREMLAQMINYLIPLYKQKEACGVPIQTTEIEGQEVDSWPMSQEYINPIVDRKAVCDSTEVSYPDKEWQIKQNEEDYLKMEIVKGIRSDACMPVHEESQYGKKNTHEEMTVFSGNFKTLDFEAIKNVVDMRRDTNQKENQFAKENVNPLKPQLKAVVEKKELGSPERIDQAYNSYNDSFLHDLDEIISMEEKNGKIGNVNTDFISQEDESYINIQNQRHDEPLPVEPTKKTWQPVAPQPAVNMDMMGFHKSNSGELSTGHTTAPETYSNDAVVAGSSLLTTITVGDEEEMILELPNGQLLKIVKQKTVTQPPLQQPVPDPLMQAMNSAGMGQFAIDYCTEQSGTLNMMSQQQTEVQQMQPNTNFIGQEQDMQYQSFFGGSFGPPIQYDHQLPCVPIIENAPVRQPVEETGTQDESMDTEDTEDEKIPMFELLL